MAADLLNAAIASKTYTSLAGDIDVANEATPSPNTAKRGPCRRIRINAAGGGALSLVYADKTTDVITSLAAGDVLDVQVAKIVASGTTVTNVTVFW